MTKLKEIYQPIEKDLRRTAGIIESSFRKSENRSIVDMGKFLLESPGKRIRPALVILSAKATLADKSSACGKQLIKIASAIELIHMASLLHDDVIDHACFRHNKPTINSKWGKDVAITLGDYLYAVAFELISEEGNPDIIHCISCAAKAMCEGELIQVCERDNMDLLKERYIVIVKKKTASLFAASCRIGALVSNGSRPFYRALEGYGLNLGIAFQIVDDYLDLVGEEKRLGKKPGQDIGVGEMTLPVLNLLESVPAKKRKEIKTLLVSTKDKLALKKLKSQIFNSDAVHKTKKAVSFYIGKAREKLEALPSSKYKESLISLAGFIAERGFSNSPDCNP